ncbi:hypothetical protein [Euzebyella saccharophila]|uniref:Uncharacterized protein n=1 Tax=Euzebyella saccharophila TaxID=679664 RepID=A0ABV8JKZ1_9FLAO|nr:hypothetical protein [Euzebyella saccharophila]
MGSVNPSQVGNGSWDYIAAINYGFTYLNWGISTIANYTFKTETQRVSVRKPIELWHQRL